MKQVFYDHPFEMDVLKPSEVFCRIKALAVLEKTDNTVFAQREVI